MSSNFKKIAQRLFFASSLSGIVLLSSCQKNCAEPDSSVNNNQTADPSGRLSRLSGEQIFTGMYFLNTEMCQYLPSLKNEAEELAAMSANNPTVHSFQQELQRNITNAILAKDPQFFDAFKKDLMSKDFFVMKQALQKSQEVFLDAIRNNQQYSSLLSLTQNILNNPADLQLLKQLNPENEKDKVMIEAILKRNQSQDSDISAKGSEYDVAVAVDVAAVVTKVAAVTKALAVTSYIVATRVLVFDSENEEFKAGARETKQEILVKELAHQF